MHDYYLAQVVAFVFHGLDVFLSLLTVISDRTLLLLQLGDEFLLMGNLFPQGADLVVLGVLVLLGLFQSGFQFTDFATETFSFTSNLVLLSADGRDIFLLILDAQVCLVQLLLNVILHGLNTVGLVNDVLNGGTTALESQHEFILFVHEAIVLSSNLLALSNGFVDVGLGFRNLRLIFGLVLGEFGTLEVGFESNPYLPPKLGLTNHVVTDCSLAAVERQLLALHLYKIHS